MDDERRWWRRESERERNEMLETQPAGRWADTEPGDQRGRTWLAWASGWA
jgi:hypothetical protein